MGKYLEQINKLLLIVELEIYLSYTRMSLKMYVGLVSLAVSSTTVYAHEVLNNTGLNTTEVLHHYGANNSTGSTLTNGTAYDVNRTVYMDGSTIGQPYEERHCVTCDAENEYNATHTSAKNATTNVKNYTTEVNNNTAAWEPAFLNNSSNVTVTSNVTSTNVEDKWEPSFLKDIETKNV